MSSKTIINAKMNIADHELARRVRSRVKTHEAFIKLFEEQIDDLREDEFFTWHKCVNVEHRELPRDQREIIWFESSERKEIKIKIEEAEEVIKWHREKVKKIEECADQLLIDLTIED